MHKRAFNLLIVLAMTFATISQVRSQDSTAVKTAADTIKTAAPTETTTPTATTAPAATTTAAASESSSSSSEGGFKFGITAGMNFSYIGSTTIVPTSQSEVGYMVGVSGSTSGNFFLHPALQFVSYVNTLTYGDAATPLTQTVHFSRCNYIRIPIQAGFRLFGRSSEGIAPPFNVELRLGVSESFLVGATDHINQGPGAAFVSDDFESMRTGLIAGLGIQVLFLSINFEYELGVTNHFASERGTDSKLDALYIVFGGSF
ncbi:MAG TPA: hypothetical protein VIX80_08240 [Candidatus Kapabacteria bacterium]